MQCFSFSAKKTEFPTRKSENFDWRVYVSTLLILVLNADASAFFFHGPFLHHLVLCLWALPSLCFSVIFSHQVCHLEHQAT